MKHTIKKKYSFTTEQQAKQMIADLYKGDEEYQFKPTDTISRHCVVYLGRLVQVQALIDELGEVVTEAILYDDYAVDVAWYPKKDIIEYDEEGNELSREVAVQDWEAWNEFELKPIEVDGELIPTPKNPKHTFR